jgi:signal transduction histidine kinase
VLSLPRIITHTCSQAGAVELDVAPMSIQTLAGRVCKAFQLVAKERRINVRATCPCRCELSREYPQMTLTYAAPLCESDDTFIVADRLRLWQALTNLVRSVGRSASTFAR